MISIAAVHQSYHTSTIEEFVILGNDALIKCTIPSFVSDFVTVVGWVDSEGNQFLRKNDHFGKCFPLL